ncbi:MAG: hypothetical protein AAFQ91_24785 [Cyanobacteria bacterium J06621_15]
MQKHQKSNRKLIALGILASSVFLTPVIPLLTSFSKTASASTTYLFPGRAENLQSSEHWYRHKKSHGSANQKLGSALTAVRFDESTKNSTNQDLDNHTLISNKVANLAELSRDKKEISRHGIPANNYQSIFKQITKSGYRLEWIDGFSVKGKIYYNLIFRPNNNKSWASFHKLTSSQYQDKFNKYTGKGFKPTQVESYRQGNKTFYAAIFVKENGAKTTTYHGISQEKHQERFNQLTQDGYQPKNISVVSINGQRRYTALYEKNNVGSFVAKSFLTPTEYQRLSNLNRRSGRQIAYLNAYVHKGKPRFTAIWNSNTKGLFIARHGLSSNGYQQNWENAIKSGFLTRNVTGYANGNSVRYAGVWRE